jgi:hypothetical protein
VLGSRGAVGVRMCPATVWRPWSGGGARREHPTRIGQGEDLGRARVSIKERSCLWQEDMLRGGRPAKEEVDDRAHARCSM